MTTKRTGTVVELQELTPGVVQLTLSFGDDPLAFLPGQNVQLQLASGVRRAYCIASAAERPEAIQICVRLGRGKGSEVLRGLKAGESIAVEGPGGDFVLPPGGDRVAFLAGDTGIAPVRSIVLHMLASRDPRPVLVLFEPADSESMLYEGDFRPLAVAGSITFEVGPIGSLIERHADSLRDSLRMVAGFEPFLAAVQQTFGNVGVSFEDCLVETFGRQPG